MYFVSSAMVKALMTWYNLLYTCSCERGELIMVSCPRVSVVLDHPVTVECPCWTMFQQGFVCIVALVMSLCMVRFLGNLCTSVYFAECSLMVCHANRILATWSGPVITYFHAVVQAGPWSDWLQCHLQVSSLWNFVAFISFRCSWSLVTWKHCVIHF